MAMIEFNKNPEPRLLQWFGVMVEVFVALVGGLILLRADSWTPGCVIVFVGTVVVVIYYLVPQVQRPFYLGWMYAVLPIGWVVSHVLLAAVYYLVITPIGFGMRVCRYDPLHRRFDRAAASYWVARKPIAETSRYFRQF